MCQSSVELSMLASGMAKQYDNYLDAVQELLDNSVSSIVKNESYFIEPNESLHLELNVVRGLDTVKTYVYDNGPGISKRTLRNEVFRTGNRNRSEGILNNVGWGLKASLAWFEQTIVQQNLDVEEHKFKLVTKSDSSGLASVEGPITGNLPLSAADSTEWREGLLSPDSECSKSQTGTHIHVTCARVQFDSDVWPSADALETKMQFIRERLGVLFAKLLTANEDNTITINFHDLQSDAVGSLEVNDIKPIYDPEEAIQKHEFDIKTSDGSCYSLVYKAGTLDLKAMADAASESQPNILTNSGKFRYRFRPSQNRQGVDVYANGRILMLSVFEDIFDLTRNNQYNYFHGVLEILPKEASTEVPTDNKKTRVDTSSELWRKITEELSKEDFLPVGKDYKQGSASKKRENGLASDDTSSSDRVASTIAGLDDGVDVFGMHQVDSTLAIKHLKKQLIETVGSPELVDATITSPPYYDLKEYGGCKDTEIGQHGSYVEYLEELRAIFGDVYDITTENGSLWVVVNTFRRNREIVQLPFDIARICQNLNGDLKCSACQTTVLQGLDALDRGHTSCPACGEAMQNGNSWILQDIVIWDKTRALPYSKKGRLRNVFEYILCFSKNADFELKLDKIRRADPAEFKHWWIEFPERYHPLGKLPRNIWEFNPPARGAFATKADVFDHPAAFPPKLVERILKLSTNPGDVVLDPFAGSGVTVGQADVMNRNAIGMELNDKYCNRYTALRQHLAEEYADTNQKSSTSEKLSQLIIGLRFIKYANKLLESLAGEIGLVTTSELEIQSVALLCSEIGYESVAKDVHGRADLVLILDNEAISRNGNQYERTAREVTTMAPCSGFGLEVRPLAMPIGQIYSFCKHKLSTGLPETMYKYVGGRHYEYSNRFTGLNWIQHINTSLNDERYDVAPIFSNIGVEVAKPTKSMTEPLDSILKHKIEISIQTNDTKVTHIPGA